MRENTSRASLSPPKRKTFCDAGSMAPGSASFMTAIWLSGSKGAIVDAKIAVNSQKKQIATPAMPTPLSKSWP